MKKYIIIDDEVLERLISGKPIEGSMRMDVMTRVITFKAWHRSTPKYRPKDHLLAKLPWGWLKESQTRIKTFASVPKDSGMAGVMQLMEQNHRSVKDALIDRELIEFC